MRTPAWLVVLAQSPGWRCRDVKHSRDETMEPHWMKVDGKIAYEAKDLRVGLFQAA